MYRAINEFKLGYQTGNNVVKDQNGDMPAYSHNILNRLATFLNCWMYIISVMLSRQKYIQLNH
jgi:hypothetical protein